ncbi:CvpA family protein [Taibaiella koreensis]|uniref:CvpA family protein n=1 Tax=Taibaiella koreensis TaxID=1268548 RepID=UPI000E59E960|nr:CvpA family protein [Taibaiella koreensis]
MIIDAIFLIFMVFFMIKGYSRGLVIALFSMLALLLGALGALKLSGTVAAHLFKDGQGGRWAPFLAYLIVFVLIVFLVRMLARLLERSFKAVALGWLNRLTGALLYGFLVSFVFSSALWLLDRMGVLSDEVRTGSVTYRFIAPIAPAVCSVAGAVLPFARHIFDDLSLFFDKLNQTIPAHVGAH